MAAVHQPSQPLQEAAQRKKEKSKRYTCQPSLKNLPRSPPNTTLSFFWLEHRHIQQQESLGKGILNSRLDQSSVTEEGGNAG